MKRKAKFQNAGGRKTHLVNKLFTCWNKRFTLVGWSYNHVRRVRFSLKYHNFRKKNHQNYYLPFFGLLFFMSHKAYVIETVTDAIWRPFCIKTYIFALFDQTISIALITYLHFTQPAKCYGLFNDAPVHFNLRTDLEFLRFQVYVMSTLFVSGVKSRTWSWSLYSHLKKLQERLTNPV